ncbi:unnamed protein product [Brassica oleracea]
MYVIGEGPKSKSDEMTSPGISDYCDHVWSGLVSQWDICRYSHRNCIGQCWMAP